MDPQRQERQTKRRVQINEHSHQRRGEAGERIDISRRERCNQGVPLKGKTDVGVIWKSPGHPYHPRPPTDEVTQGLNPKQEVPPVTYNGFLQDSQPYMELSEHGVNNYDWLPWLGSENSWNDSGTRTPSETNMLCCSLDTCVDRGINQRLNAFSLGKDFFSNQLPLTSPGLQSYCFPGSGECQLSRCEDFCSSFQGSNTGYIMEHLVGEIANPNPSVTSSSVSPPPSTLSDWPENHDISPHSVPANQYPHEAYDLKVDTGAHTGAMTMEMGDLDHSYNFPSFATLNNGGWCQTGSSLLTTCPGGGDPNLPFAIPDLIAANNERYQHLWEPVDSSQGLPQTWINSEPFDSHYQLSPCHRVDINSDNGLEAQREAARSPTDRSDCKDDFLVRCKLAGMSYKEIKEKGEFVEAESTLRGRFRTLTKRKEHRVRKPGWVGKDLKLLCEAVAIYTSPPKRTSAEETRLPKVSWKRVGEYIWNNGGTYHFGNATCKKKWEELQERCKM